MRGHSSSRGDSVVLASTALWFVTFTTSHSSLRGDIACGVSVFIVTSLRGEVIRSLEPAVLHIRSLLFFISSFFSLRFDCSDRFRPAQLSTALHLSCLTSTCVHVTTVSFTDWLDEEYIRRSSTFAYYFRLSSIQELAST